MSPNTPTADAPELNLDEVLLEDFSVMELEERFEFAMMECCTLNGNKCNTGPAPAPETAPSLRFF